MSEEINVSFTQGELIELTDILLPLLQNETGDSDHYDQARLERLSAALKIALAVERFNEFERSSQTFFECTQQLKSNPSR